MSSFIKFSYLEDIASAYKAGLSADQIRQINDDLNTALPDLKKKYAGRGVNLVIAAFVDEIVKYLNSLASRYTALEASDLEELFQAALTGNLTQQASSINGGLLKAFDCYISEGDKCPKCGIPYSEGKYQQVGANYLVCTNKILDNKGNVTVCNQRKTATFRTYAWMWIRSSVQNAINKILDKKLGKSYKAYICPTCKKEVDEVPPQILSRHLPYKCPKCGVLLIDGKIAERKDRPGYYYCTNEIVPGKICGYLFPKSEIIYRTRDYRSLNYIDCDNPDCINSGVARFSKDHPETRVVVKRVKSEDSSFDVESDFYKGTKGLTLHDVIQSVSSDDAIELRYELEEVVKNLSKLFLKKYGSTLYEIEDKVTKTKKVITVEQRIRTFVDRILFRKSFKNIAIEILGYSPIVKDIYTRCKDCNQEFPGIVSQCPFCKSTNVEPITKQLSGEYATKYLESNGHRVFKDVCKKMQSDPDMKPLFNELYKIVGNYINLYVDDQFNLENPQVSDKRQTDYTKGLEQLMKELKEMNFEKSFITDKIKKRSLRIVIPGELFLEI